MLKRKSHTPLPHFAGALSLLLIYGCGGPDALSDKEIEKLNVSCHYSAFIVKHLWDKFEPYDPAESRKHPPGEANGSLHDRVAYQGDQSEDIYVSERMITDENGNKKAERIIDKYQRNTKFDLAILITNEVKRDMDTFRRECRPIYHDKNKACMISTVQHKEFGKFVGSESIYHQFVFYNYENSYDKREFYLAEMTEIITGIGYLRWSDPGEYKYRRACQIETSSISVPRYEKYRTLEKKYYEEIGRSLEVKSK